MSTYMTEEEQIELIKSWWKRYNRIITTVLFIVLLLLASWKYLSWHTNKMNQQASTSYEQLMMAVSNNNEEDIVAYAKHLIKNNNHSVYADAARLALAKYKIENNKDEAGLYLDKVNHSKALHQIANIRLARIYLMDSAYEKALKTLDEVKHDAYYPLINEIRGDVYAEMGDYQQALKAYDSALSDGKIKGLGHSFLEMKYRDTESKITTTGN